MILFKTSCSDIISCMDITLTTPALLFPTVSLLMLAYTNRFLALASIIRNLHDRYKVEDDKNLLGQIANLRYRTYLIRDMQIAGVLSLLFCVISMFALFAGWTTGGQWSFAMERWTCCWRSWRMKQKRVDGATRIYDITSKVPSKCR